VRLLIDGLNVIGTRPDGWWKDRHGAMVRLVETLERFAEETGDEVTVVFEKPPSPPIESALVAVAHGPARPNAADDEILRRLESDPHPEQISVVTSDTHLAARARAASGSVQPASAFRAFLDEL
jgi:predicted RNA-binding protein with PIN domain